MKILYEFFNCFDCPYCKKGVTYGNDGRDGWTVYICEKGAFGKRDGCYAEGKYCKEVHDEIDENCPLKNLE